MTSVDSICIGLTWAEPNFDGGCEIEEYIIEQREVKRSWSSKINTEEHNCLVENLTEGKTYNFRVAAVNEVGTGEWTELKEPVTAKSKFSKLCVKASPIILERYFPGHPSPPKEPKVTEIFKESCEFTWLEPENDGGKPVTGYFIEKRQTSSKLWLQVNKQSVPENNITVSELVEGNEYVFRVIAENEVGQSEPSTQSSPIIAKLPYGTYKIK